MKINYDISGEISLLGTCITISDMLMESCQALTPEHFHSLNNQIIFTSILELYKEGSEVNLTNLMSRLKIKGELESVQETLAHLKPAAALGNFKANLNNILINHKKTQIAALLKTLSSNFEEKTIEQISDQCNSYFNNTSKVTTYTLEDISTGKFYGHANHEEYVGETKKAFLAGKKIPGIPTGFFQLDMAIGGLNPSHYVIIAGQPGSGKTTFALQIMKHITENGIKCGFLSIEMTKEQAYNKLISSEAVIPYDRLVRGQFDDTKYYEILFANEKLKKNKHLYIQDATIDNLMALRSRVKYLVQVKGVQVLIVDYITLIKAATQSSNPVEAVVAISSEIRSLLKELNIPGIIISQLNRSASDASKAPDKHHLYGSGQLEKDAHEILMLHPDEFSKDRKLYIRKSRFSSGDNVLSYSFENGIFKEKECY